MVELRHIEFETNGKNDIIDLTPELEKIIAGSALCRGSVLIFVPGATGALSTMEYEPGLLQDLPQLMSRLIPENQPYHHNETWHDGNGHSHLRATLIGPSLVIPFENRKMLLGTWQQVIFLEFDNRPHQRRLPVQISGEK